MRPSPTLTQDEIIEIWQRRCDRYKAWNRGWIMVALVWLAIVGSAFAYSYFGPSAGSTLMRIIGGTVLFVGFPVFQIASLSVGKMLRCPSCGRRVETRDAKVESVTSCSHCNVAFRFDALPDSIVVPRVSRRPAG
jgi:hypothetical protein